MTQLRQHADRIHELDMQVAVVTFDDDFMARGYVEQTDLQWPMLLDREVAMYRAYSMDRADLWSIYGPASIWNYLKLISRGRKIEKPGTDLRQLGGDVLIDPAGIVRYHFVSTSPHDRPSPEDILQHVG